MFFVVLDVSVDAFRGKAKTRKVCIYTRTHNPYIWYACPMHDIFFPRKIKFSLNPSALFEILVRALGFGCERICARVSAIGFGM